MKSKKAKAAALTSRQALVRFLLEELGIATKLTLYLVLVIAACYFIYPNLGYFVALAIFVFYTQASRQLLRGVTFGQEKVPERRMKPLRPLIEKSGISPIEVCLTKEIASPAGAIGRTILVREDLFRRSEPEIQGAVAHELGHIIDFSPLRGMAWLFQTPGNIMLVMLLPGLAAWLATALAVDGFWWHVALVAPINVLLHHVYRLLEAFSERRANKHAQRLLGKEHPGLEMLFEKLYAEVRRKDPVAGNLPKFFWIFHPHSDLENQLRLIRFSRK